MSMNFLRKTKPLTLVLGGTGKTGRRVADRLKAAGETVRIGSRSATPGFDWDTEASWDAALKDVTAAYITYAPDLAFPGATDAIERFVHKAKRAGVKRLVLLSGRGEEEAQACECIVQVSGIDWTIVRASWFNQNFSEGAFIDMVLNGAITLPAGDTPEPFVDADDIADVVVAALTQDHHFGEVYEVTGPRL
ncbi:MAG: NAD(P)H-binding protein, partial [Pseudomonadota bacterium]